MNPDELPDFPLASWELPPDSTEPLIAPATMRWHGTLFGHETDWLVRELPNEWPDTVHVLVRAISFQEEANWWIFNIDFDFIPDHFRRISRLLSSMVPERPWRVIHLLHDDKNWTIYLRSVAESSLHFAETSVQFSIEWPLEFSTATATQVHDEVLRAWNDENSDLSYARNWILLSEPKQYAIMIRWMRGTEVDFLRVMRLVLLALGTRVSEDSLRWWYHPIHRRFPLANAEVKINLSNPEVPFIHNWGYALLDVYQPVWNEELTQTRICTRSLSNFSDYLAVIVEPPTFHEQLEAARELSIWIDEREARGELPAATIARLHDTLR